MWVSFSSEPADPPYLVFLGRISPEKGPIQAVEVARRLGLPLKIAAKIDPADRAWAEVNFLPLLSTPGVEYLGEVDEQQKAELLRGALALLFPIDWPEPFGLVMAEAMACGTPVVAFPGGSVEEVVKEGVTGWICRSRTVEEMVEAVKRVDKLDRRACRLHVEQNFSSSAMAERYEVVYRQLLEEARGRGEVLPASPPQPRGPASGLSPWRKQGERPRPHQPARLGGRPDGEGHPLPQE